MPVNNAPTANNGSAAMNEDTILNGTLPPYLDLDGNPVTYSLIGSAGHGTVVVNPNGTYTYTPDLNYNGADGFTFRVTDSLGAFNDYTLSLTINPVNDAPTASSISIITNEDTAYSNNLPAASDVDGDIHILRLQILMALTVSLIRSATVMVVAIPIR